MSYSAVFPAKSSLGRLQVAVVVVEALGAALMMLRNQPSGAWIGLHGQLKTSIDQAAEGWVLGYLRASYPKDQFLSEELFEQTGDLWHAPPAFWTIDALDGTRSFVEGFNGFCVQVAYVRNGKVEIGVVHEPVRGVTYWAMKGCGAFRQVKTGECKRLHIQVLADWPPKPVFVDSTYPKSLVGQLIRTHNGRFLECGSIGLKICRIADGEAHVFAKSLKFKTWDVAPGHLILAEAGGRLGLWNASNIDYKSKEVYYDNLIAAPKGLFSLVVQELSKRAKAEAKSIRAFDISSQSG